MAEGSNCRTGCKEGGHASYAECLRAGLPRIAYCDSGNGRDATRQKKWDKNLADYKDARAEGLQPSGTQPHQIEAAKRISDATGTAYRAK